MSFDYNREERLRDLRVQLRRAHTVAPPLMAEVIAQACVRLQAQQRSARVLRLVQSGASTDAALALLELELPQWALRRLVYEDGEWHCTLSKHLGVPAELDDLAEGEHENLPLAILSAFVEARRRGRAGEPRRQTVPRVGPAQGHALCCDNFV